METLFAVGNFGFELMHVTDKGSSSDSRPIYAETMHFHSACQGMEAFSCINYKLWVTITNCCINNNFCSVSDISVTIDPIKREDGQEIKVYIEQQSILEHPPSPV